MKFRIPGIIIGALLLTGFQVVVPLFHYELSTHHTVPLFLANLLLLNILSLYFYNSIKQNYLLQTLLIFYIPGCLSILVESYLFEVTDVWLTLLGLLQGFTNTLFIFIFITVSFLKDTPPERVPVRITRSKLNLIGRILAGISLYVIIYFIAGILLQITFPELNEFYQGKIPPIDVIVMTQVLRGFLLVLVAIWFVRHSRLSSIKSALLLGALFSIVGGLSPLLAPNDLMPASIRIAHGVEVCTSNFIYGFCLALLVSPPKHEVSD